MKRVISISQIVAPFHTENGSWEVWASADANCNEAKSRLEVKLDSFLRRSRDDKRLTLSWLPKARTVLSTISYEEGSSLAEKVFEQWVQRLRRSIQLDAGSGQQPPESLLTRETDPSIS